jgi:hypothetical protein
MSNKRVQVSDDSGSTFFTLPGNQGEFRTELANVNDTIFGQSFESNQVGLGQFNLPTNGIWKGVAGYSVILKKSGTATSMTGEATTLVSGKTYQITSATKRVLSYVNSITVLDNGVDHTADVISIDYLTGQVTFDPSYTVTGAVTVTGHYMPMAVVAKARSFTLTQSSGENDETGYEDAQANGGFKVFAQGLKTINLELGGIFRVTNGWQAVLESRGLVYVELDIAGDGKSVFRGFFKVGNRGQSGNQGDVEAESIQLGLWVPDGSLVSTPASWTFTSGHTLNTALVKVLTAFYAGSELTVRYLPTGTAAGTDGQEGSAIVTEVSLANTIDGQNEFSVNFRGTEEPGVV